MNETYVIYLEDRGEFFESFEKDCVEGDVFSTYTINGAKQFDSLDEAIEMSNIPSIYELAPAVLKWM